MSEIVPKKERHLWYWLQWITIFISLLAVFASLFAGWMAYNASISAAAVSWKFNKENEIESRLYQQKYELYKSIIAKFPTIIEYKPISDEWKVKWFNELEKVIKEFIKLLKDIWPEIRILWWDKLIKDHNCVFEETSNYLDELYWIYSWEDDRTWDEKIRLVYEGLKINLIWWMHLLEESMRTDLWLTSLPYIYTSHWAPYNLTWTWYYYVTPDCSKVNSNQLNMWLYIK